MFLVVGLGNPGAEYKGNRHNTGFMATDEIVRRYNFGAWKSRFNAQVSEGVIDGEKVIVLQPQTFMNNSGQAVRAAMDFYKLPVSQVIVFHDEMDIPVGKVKAKVGGGAGGHNGLKSVIGFCGEGFPRVRMGVGEKPTPEYDLADWVTGKLPEADMKALQGRFDDVCEAVRLMLTGDYDRAMNLYNR